MSRAKQILARLALVAGAMLFVLLLCEVALRLVGISYPRTTQADDVLGVLHRPNVSFRFQDEGDAWIQYNSEAFRDVEWVVEKPSNEFRIAVLGDSYVEALQVDVEERFTEIMAVLLRQGPFAHGKDVRVMNFGMSGFGTGQELLLLKDRVARYKPDLVVLCFLTGNDLTDNYRALRPEVQRPFFELRDGELQLDESYKEWIARDQRWQTRSLYALADWSRLVQVGYRVRKVLQTKASIAREKANGGDQANELGLNDGVYQEPTSADWRAAWEVTERLLLAVDDEARQQGAKLLVVTLSNAIQVHPEHREREAFGKKLGVEDLFYPDRRVARFCELHQIPVLTLAPLFLEYAQDHDVFLHGFAKTGIGGGHWNHAGHRLAAELIVPRIREIVDSPQ